MEVKVTNYLDKKGFPRHVKGFRYLRTAILLAIQDWSYLDAVTLRLYPVLAKQYNTTPSRVERAIRHAIEITYGENKPCNSEFIALAADSIKMQEGEDTSTNFIDSVDRKAIVDALEFYIASKQLQINHSDNEGFKTQLKTEISFLNCTLERMKANE